MRLNKAYPHEQGAALMVSLVLIFMLTIMGISNMRSSNMDRRMTSNAIQSTTTFQAAESSTEWALNDPDNMNDALKDIVKLTPQLSNSEQLKIGVDLEYVGDGVPTGYSLGANSGGFTSLRFEVLGTARLATTEAQSSVLQGAYRVVPAKN